MEMPVLRKHYLDVVVPELCKKLGYSNIHEVPKIEKIVINSGINAEQEKAWIADVAKEIGNIAGQKPVITKSRKSISNFKLKKGVPNGIKVTLRGPRMYEFLYRLIAISLPLIRDFRGLGRKFDGQGNYTLGISDHVIFPEVHVDSNRKNLGMDITVVTSAKSDEEGRELLTLMGFPFRKDTAAAKKTINA